MKKIIFSILGAFLLVTGITITACGPSPKATISLSSSDFTEENGENVIYLSLNPGDDSTAVVYASVANANDGRVEVVNQSDHIDKIKSEVNFNANKNQSTISLTALEETEEPIEVKIGSISGSAELQSFKVYIYSDITGLSQSTNTFSQYVLRDDGENGIVNDLNVMAGTLKTKYLNFEARDTINTSRLRVNYSFNMAFLPGKTQKETPEGLRLVDERDDSVVYATLSNGQLVVNQNYIDSQIFILASSVYTEHFAELELNVIDSFKQSDIAASYSRYSDQTFGSLAELNGATLTNGEYAVSVVRNDDSVESKEFFVKFDINSDYELAEPTWDVRRKETNELTDDYLLVNVESDQNPNDHSFTIKVKGKKSAVNPSEVYISFKFGYKNYDYSITTQPLLIAISDVVDNMDVTASDDNVVYTYYKSAPGKMFNVDLKPDTVLPRLATYEVRLNVPGVNTAERLSDYISVVGETGALANFTKEGDDFVATTQGTGLAFNDNSYVYVCVTDEAARISLPFEVKFVSTQTRSVVRSYRLTAKKSPNPDEFKLKEGVENVESYLALNPNNSVYQTTVSFEVEGIDSADDLFVDGYDENLFEIGPISYALGRVSFVVTTRTLNHTQNQIVLNLKHNNGASIEGKIFVNLFTPIVSANIGIDAAKNYGVSSIEQDSNNTLKLKVMYGTTIQFDYIVVGEYLDVNLAQITPEPINFNKETGVFDASTVGKFSFDISFSGYNENHQQISTQATTIEVEVYVPISMLALASTDAQGDRADLITSDSISSLERDKSIKEFVFNFRTDNNEVSYYEAEHFRVYSGLENNAAGHLLTESEIYIRGNGFNYKIYDIVITSRRLSFKVEAISTNGFDSFVDHLRIEYNNPTTRNTARAEIIINAKTSVRVNKVIWNNQDSEVYLDSTSNNASENSFVFRTSLQPSQAYNKNLRFIFLADSPDKSNAISIDSTLSLIRAAKNVDATGYIYIIPEDAIKYSTSGEQIIYFASNSSESLSTLNLREVTNENLSQLLNGYFISGRNGDDIAYTQYSQVIVKARVIVAAGNSKETALRIYDKNQLSLIKDGLHYVIMRDLEISSSITANFASLSGYVEPETADKQGSRSSVVLTLTRPLVGTLTSEVSDLTFVGQVQGRGFIANENEGKISHITIDINKNGQEINPSTVTATREGESAGAVVGVNTGTIEYALILGVSVSADVAGGAVGESSGTINNVYIEIYKFTKKDENGDSSPVANQISGKTSAGGFAGGFAGKATGGKIENSYIYDYSMTETSGANLKGENIGAFVGEVDGSFTISNSFAVVNIEKVVANVIASGSATTSVTTSDIYNSYYKDSSYTSVSKVSDHSNWLEESQIISYVNGEKKHLKFYQSEGLTKDQLNKIKLKSVENKSIEVDDIVDGNNKTSCGILMYYTTQIPSVTLENNEQTALLALNTISIQDLFGYGSDKIIVSSNSNIITATSTSLIVNGVGDASLTIYSRTDFESNKTITIKVIYAIREFDNSARLSPSGNLSVQLGTAKSVMFSVNQSIYLVSNSYELTQNKNMSVTVERTPTSGDISIQSNGFEQLITVKNVNNNSSDRYIVTGKLKLNLTDDTFEKAIEKKFTSSFDLIAFKGSKFIGLSADTLTLLPSMNVALSADVLTDTESEQIIINVYKKELDEEILIGSIETSNQSEPTTIQDGEVQKLSIVVNRKGDNFIPTSTINFLINISVCDSFKNQISDTQNFVLEFKSTSGSASNEGVKLALNVERQSIDYISMTNYTHDIIRDGQYVRKSQMTSTLSPGSTSYMVIGIDPKFAYFDYFKVSAYTSSGISLSIDKMLPVGRDYYGSNYQFDNLSSVSRQGYDLKVVPSSRDPLYIFKLYIPPSIKTSEIVPFVISFYNKDDTLIEGSRKQFNLMISYQRPAGIVVNGNQNSVIAKGGTADIRVNVLKGQVLDSLFVVSANNISVKDLTGPFSDDDGDYYTAKLYAAVNASVTDGTGGLGAFQLRAQVSRTLNSVPEVTQSTYELTLVDFSIKETTQDVQVNLNMQNSFNINYVFDPETYDEEGVEDLIRKREEFRNNHYYINEGEEFTINSQYKGNSEVDPIPLTERLWIVSSSGAETKIVFNENGIANCGAFDLVYDSNEQRLNVIGRSTTASTIVVRLDNYIKVAKNASSYNIRSMYFNVTVSLYTDEEKNLIPISDQASFEAIESNETPLDYILTNDIELINYKPISSTRGIASLDGNGYQIKLTSFNLEGSGTLRLALFDTVSNGTTLKNLRVNYYYGGTIDVDVTSSGYNNITIAGFAITNNGLITNCEVISLPYAQNDLSKRPSRFDPSNTGLNIKFRRFSSYVNQSSTTNFTVNVSGFVDTNSNISTDSSSNSSGVITNSRVGGSEIIVLNESQPSGYDEASATLVSLPKFSIISQGTISGFVRSNSGSVVSSFVKQVDIKNETYNTALSTAGFVDTNSNRISNCYVEGVRSETTNLTYCLDGSSISGRGFVSGFANNNTNRIEDCYSNIAIKGVDEGQTSFFGSGFVYTNTGAIAKCYSGCLISTGNISQSNFSGVDIKGDPTQNTGTISLSYYNGKAYSAIDQSDVESLIESGAIIAQNPGSQTQFYGFTFASENNSNDGIWSIYDNILTLVAPNKIAFSHRAQTQIIGTQNYAYPYTKVNVEGLSTNSSDYVYGGENNPIIIRDEDELKSALGGADSSTNIGKMITKIDGNFYAINGSYRLMGNIDLSKLNSTEENTAVINSTHSSFSGVFDGNGFTIDNISIGGSDESIGFFSQIYKASVLNLNLRVLSASGTQSGFVGALAGIMYSSNLINLSVSQVVPGTGSNIDEFGVRGENAIGELVGAVFGDCKIAGITVDNPIVSSNFYESNRNNGYLDFYEKADQGQIDYVRKDDDDDSQANSEKIYPFSPAEIRKLVENGKTESSTRTGGYGYFSTESIDNLSLSSRTIGGRNLGQTSFAGGIFGYLDVYNESQILSSGYSGVDVNISDSRYRIYNLRVNNSATVLGEVVGGLIGYAGIHSYIKDAGLIIDRDTMSSNILSVNAYAGGIIGYSTTTLKKIYSEHAKDIQDEIEDSFNRYYQGGEAAERGIDDIFENTLSSGSSDEFKRDYYPKYIGGLIGYQRVGALSASYSKLNVVANVSDVMAGGIVGKIGAPKANERFVASSSENVQNTGSTSVYYSEVYSSGDVKGFTEDGVTQAGGIVGEMSTLAKITLSAVNAVNFWSSLSYDRAAIKDNKLSSINIYALIGKLDGDGSGKIADRVAYDRPFSATSINTNKHIGYIANVKTSNIDLMLTPYKDYDEANQENATTYFKINPLVNIPNSEAGYVEMHGHFLSSGNWSTENWIHYSTDPFPSIKYINIEDFIYLDQYNKDEVLAKIINNSSKEVRVRGLTEEGGTIIMPINLTSNEILNANNGSISNFSGRFIGGWAANGDKDINQAYNQRIIIDKPLFRDLQPNVTFSDLWVQFGNKLDNNGSTNENNKNFENNNGSTFITNTVNEVMFNDVVFDYSNINTKIIVDADTNGYAGLVLPAATNTSFNNVTLIMNQGDEGNASVQFNLEAGQVNRTGLLAGKVEQNSQYRTLSLTGLKMYYTSEQKQRVISNSGEASNIYSGLFVGDVSHKLNSADVAVSVDDIENNTVDGQKASSSPDENGPIKFSFEGGSNDNSFEISIDNASPSYEDVYMGLFGRLGDDSKGTDGAQKESPITSISYDSAVYTNAIFSVPNATNAYVGLMAGKAYTSSVASGASVASTKISSTINYSQVSSGAYLGGLFGDLNCGKGKFDLNFKNLTTKIAPQTDGELPASLPASVYAGGLVGKLQAGAATLTSTKIQNVENTNFPINDEYNIDATLDINLTGNESTDINLGGVFGNEDLNSLSLTGISFINSKIELSSTGTIGTVSAGLLDGTKKTNGSAGYNISNGLEDENELNVSGWILTNPTNSTNTENKSYPTITTANFGGLIGLNNGGHVNIKNVNVNLQIGTKTNDNNPLPGFTKETIIEKTANGGENNTPNAISVGSAYIGGYIGQNSGQVDISGGEIIGDTNSEDGTRIAITAKDATDKYNIYMGGAVGFTTGVVNVKKSNKSSFKNDGLFSVEQNQQNSYLGGVIGYVAEPKNDVSNISPVITIGEENNTAEASTNVTANFFANAKNVNFGGIIGYIQNWGANSKISNSVFGGALKLYGANSEGGELYFGGILGQKEQESQNNHSSGKISNNISYGDVIVTYLTKAADTPATTEADDPTNTSFTKLTTFIAGGIVGHNGGKETKENGTVKVNAVGIDVSNNYSLTTINNDQYALTDHRYAIQADGHNKGGDNYFSHLVTLVEDANGFAKDAGYMTAFKNNEGYDYTLDGNKFNIEKTNTLLNMIGISKNNVTANEENEGQSKTAHIKLPPEETFASGSKLKPIKLDIKDENEQKVASGTGTGSTNGVRYYYIDEDSPIEINTISVTVSTKFKRAIIGDTKSVKRTFKSSSGEDAFIAQLQQNEIVSGLNLEVDIFDDNTSNYNIGGLVNKMTGGTIFNVTVHGEMSIGGSSKINIGGVVGNMSGGFIYNTASDVHIIYRAGKGGTASDFATTTAGRTNYIAYSYSTGQVTSYIDANLYSFTNGVSTNLRSVYTISQIDWHDHTLARLSPDGTKQGVFGEAEVTTMLDKDDKSKTLKTALYDPQAVEIDIIDKANNKPKENCEVFSEGEFANAFSNDANGRNSTITKNLNFEASDWVLSRDFNYGYPTRPYNYLKLSSYAKEAETTKEDGTKLYNEDGTLFDNNYNGIELTTYERLTWLETLNAAKDKKLSDKFYFIVPNARKLAQIDDDFKGKGQNGEEKVVEALLNANYVLWYDIDLQQSGVGQKDSDKQNVDIGPLISGIFSGKFDGQEHTIQNSKVAIFDEINDNFIKNLRVIDVDIGGDLKNTSVQVDRGDRGVLANTADSVTINNVITSGFLDFEEVYTQCAFGGIVGDATDVTVKNCKNYVKVDVVQTKDTDYLNKEDGKVTKGSNPLDAGGIIGSLHGQDSKIVNCYNYGPINQDAVAGTAGGIVGALQEGGTFENCGNNNSVLCGYVRESQFSADKYFGMDYNAGGIIGWAGGANTISITNCYNTAMIKAGNKANGSNPGKVIGAASVAYAGGIVGHIERTITIGDTFNNLYNSGVIEALGKNLKAATDIDYEFTTDPFSSMLFRLDLNIIEDLKPNIYAQAIVGNTSINGVNSGNIIRNGIYDTEWTTSALFIWYQRPYSTADDDYEITLADRKLNILSVDPLGFPTGFVLSAKRSVKIKGTDIYIIQNQEIVSCKAVIDGNEYYENRVITSSSTSTYELCKANNRKSPESENVKIAGVDYSFVYSGSALNKIRESNDSVNNIVLMKDISIGSVSVGSNNGNSIINVNGSTHNLSGNNYFLNYAFKDGAIGINNDHIYNLNLAGVGRFSGGGSNNKLYGTSSALPNNSKVENFMCYDNILYILNVTLSNSFTANYGTIIGSNGNGSKIAISDQTYYYVKGRGQSFNLNSVPNYGIIKAGDEGYINKEFNGSIPGIDAISISGSPTRETSNDSIFPLVNDCKGSVEGTYKTGNSSQSNKKGYAINGKPGPEMIEYKSSSGVLLDKYSIRAEGKANDGRRYDNFKYDDREMSYWVYNEKELNQDGEGLYNFNWNNEEHRYYQVFHLFSYSNYAFVRNSSSTEYMDLLYIDILEKKGVADYTQMEFNATTTDAQQNTLYGPGINITPHQVGATSDPVNMKHSSSWFVWSSNNSDIWAKGKLSQSIESSIRPRIAFMFELQSTGDFWGYNFFGRDDGHNHTNDATVYSYTLLGNVNNTNYSDGLNDVLNAKIEGAISVKYQVA